MWLSQSVAAAYNDGDDDDDDNNDDDDGGGGDDGDGGDDNYRSPREGANQLEGVRLTEVAQMARKG